MDEVWKRIRFIETPPSCFNCYVSICIISNRCVLWHSDFDLATSFDAYLGWYRGQVAGLRTCTHVHHLAGCFQPPQNQLLAEIFLSGDQLRHILNTVHSPINLSSITRPPVVAAGSRNHGNG